MQKITTFLMFEGQAEEAMNLYTGTPLVLETWMAEPKVVDYQVPQS